MVVKSEYVAISVGNQGSEITMTSTTLKNTLFYGCLMLFLSGSSCLNDIIDLENNRANELASDLAGLNPIASLITQIDIPEDNTPQGPEDEDDAGSASGISLSLS